MKYAQVSADNKEVARVICADNYFLRLRGLIGRKLEKGQGLILSPCHQIHTFFMSYPIDVVYLDVDYRILRVDDAIAPGKSCKSEKNARHILELPADSASQLGLAPGDNLTLTRLA